VLGGYFLLASGSARSSWPNRSGFAFSAFTIIGFHLPSITAAAALTGTRKLHVLGSPQLQKGAYWTIDRCMPTIISQKLEAANLETRHNGVLSLDGFFPRTRSMVTAVLQGGAMQFKWAELQTSDAQLKRMAYGGFKVLVAA